MHLFLSLLRSLWQGALEKKICFRKLSGQEENGLLLYRIYSSGVMLQSV